MPERASHITLRGHVISGRGTASRSRVGESPISDFFGELQAPGSLNVAFEKPIRFDPEKVAFPGGHRAYYWAAEINGSRCLLTRAKGHPLHIVEVLSPYRLREKFQLKDGDSVEIKVVSNLVVDLSWEIKAIWSIFWEFRGSWYASRVYRALIGPFWLIRRLATQSPQYHAKLWNRERLQGDVSVCHINLARVSKLRGGARQTELLVRELSRVLPKQRLVVLQHEVLANRLDDVPNLEICRVRNRLSALGACRGACLLHAHETHAAQVAYVASFRGSRYIITRRTDSPIGSSFFTRGMYRNAKTVVALSTAIENQIRKKFAGIPTARIPDAWTPRDPSKSKQLEIRQRHEGKFLVGHIAAMDGEGKGHGVLLQAARILQETNPDIHFLLLGSGRLEDKFRQQGRGLANVFFQGWQEDPFSWIAAFDIFAFPSLREGLGSILLDVLRAGVPIVASRTGGIPDVVTDDCGTLVAPGNADALAQELLRLHNSPAVRERLSQGAKARAVEFSSLKMAERYVDLYRTLDVF